jgi:hypothetical protein
VIPALVRAAAAFVGEPPPAGERRAALAARIAEMIGRQPRDRRLLLAGGALVLDLLPLARRGRRFRALDDEAAAATLAALADSSFSSLRRLHAALKLMLQFAWYADPAADASCDYDGPWLGRTAVAAAPPPRLESPKGPAC